MLEVVEDTGRGQQAGDEVEAGFVVLHGVFPAIIGCRKLIADGAAGGGIECGYDLGNGLMLEYAAVTGTGEEPEGRAERQGVAVHGGGALVLPEGADNTVDIAVGAAIWLEEAEGDGFTE